MTGGSQRISIVAMLRHSVFPLGVFLAACFGVFVLPFLLPPPPLAGLSAANAAGFNNKLASIAAAILSILVFFVGLKLRSLKSAKPSAGYGPLGRRLVLTIALLCGGTLALLSYIIDRSHLRYLYDAGYFMQQIGLYEDYHLKLYDQIEFAYGPLLFYGPVMMRFLLSPLHITSVGAYFTVLVLEQITGLLLVAYVIDNLPILRKWKTLLFLLCALQALQLNFGLNYLFFRFVIPAAFLVLAAKQRRTWRVALCFFTGQMVCLSLSPEMGFAFGVGSTAYAVYFCFVQGRAWVLSMVAPLLATAAFLLLAGEGYLRMPRMFAHGEYNLIVAPLPHILVFLFALIWLVPLRLAVSFRERRREWPLLAALYVFSLALLPVCFGRADASHVFFNGMALYFISFIAIASYPPRTQVLWATCVSVVLLWTIYVNVKVFQYPFREMIHYSVLHPGDSRIKRVAGALIHNLPRPVADHYFAVKYPEDAPFALSDLQAIVGDAPVALPYEVPLPVEESLKRAGQYAPSFYCFQYNMLDDAAEDRAIKELNASQWALMPKDGFKTVSETPAESGFALGFDLPYRMTRVPYVVGRRFAENLKTRWEPYGAVGGYVVYRRR